MIESLKRGLMALWFMWAAMMFLALSMTVLFPFVAELDIPRYWLTVHMIWTLAGFVYLWFKGHTLIFGSPFRQLKKEGKNES